MEPRKVSASQGWKWITGGFALFLKAPLVWVALFGAYVLVAFLIAMIPHLGSLLVELLSPLVIAGFLLGCKALEQGEELELAHLLSGFRHEAAQLITVGGLYLLGTIVINAIMTGVGGDQLAKLAELSMEQSPDPEQAREIVRGLMLPMSLGAFLLTPLVMALWFAPALVVFHKVPAIESMKQSFIACARNMPALLVYGLATMVLLVLAMIPFSLGLMVLGPVLIASSYVAYKDVFLAQPIESGKTP